VPLRLLRLLFGHDLLRRFLGRHVFGFFVFAGFDFFSVRGPDLPSFSFSSLAFPSPLFGQVLFLDFFQA